MFPDRQNPRWMLDHVGSFRMLSFLPVAEVERTATGRVYRLWGKRRFIAATLCKPREWGELQTELGIEGGDEGSDLVALDF